MQTTDVLASLGSCVRADGRTGRVNVGNGLDGGVDLRVGRGQIALLRDAPEHVANLPDAARQDEANAVSPQFLMGGDEHPRRP